MTSTLVRQSVVQSQGRGAVQDSSRERLVSPTLAENPRERRAYAFIYREQQCIDARSGQAFTAERRRPKTERGRARRELLPLHVCCATASIGLCSYRAARRRDHRFRDLPGHRSGHARRVRPWYLTHWHFAPPLFPITRVLGAALIVAGLPILLDSFARFALQGLGTPAPVMPPKRLVVTGFYRYVRNPIYVAVTALIAGQGLLFGSVTVLEYGAIVWAGFFLFVVAYEEPALGEQFADEYKRYRANVRRWLPRITPWRG